MTFRTLRVQSNMEYLLFVMCAVLVVAASKREKPIQLLRTMATAGMIREHQLEDRKSVTTWCDSFLEKTDATGVCDNGKEKVYSKDQLQDAKKYCDGKAECVGVTKHGNGKYTPRCGSIVTGTGTSWLNRDGCLSGFVRTGKSYCKPQTKTDWKSLTEATKECLKIRDCHMFYESLSTGKYYYCSRSAQIRRYYLAIFYQPDACSPSPCYNGGTCTIVDGAPKCECPNGYSGDNCKINKKYILSEANGVCSDSGISTIMSSNECRSSISKIPKFGRFVDFKGEENEISWPKGCYVYGTGNFLFKSYPGYWNNHNTGSPNALGRQVCIQPAPESCEDGITNQDETDTDCGGSNCSPCPPESCEDGIKNQDEIYTDCGGTNCSPCQNYVVKPANQVCTSNEIIDNVDECKVAISRWANIELISIDWSLNSYPKGCWKSVRAKGNAYWNPHSSGSASVNANAICKAVEGCGDTDFGATDKNGNTCEDYTGLVELCGQLDDDDFSSHQMCCTCGGGAYATCNDGILNQDEIDVDCGGHSCNACRHCVCKAHWDDSDYLASCANQQGCTDCDGSGYTWCLSSNLECDTVQRDENGYSQGWFRCEKDTEYQKADNSHGCCTNEWFHRRCDCSHHSLTGCMQLCNEDVHCKGYVSAASSCQIATISSCPSGCLGPYNTGYVGELSFDGSCGSGYGGCFIKKT